MKNMKEAFGTNLRNLRKNKKLTLEKFSEMIEVTPRQLTRIESGETFLSAETLCKISIALDVKLKNLFDVNWYDNLMYYHNGKYSKPNVRAVINENKSVLIKSLLPLTNKKIHLKERMNYEKAVPYLMDFSKENKIDIIVEIFNKKQRDKILRISPHRHIETIITKSDLTETINYQINNDYEYVIDKIKDFSADEMKIQYIKSAINALSDKKAMEELKAMIKGIELMQAEKNN